MGLFQKPGNLVAVLLAGFLFVVFFFFPWLALDNNVILRGYEIPRHLNSLGRFLYSSGLDASRPPGVKLYLLFILYLLPVFCAATIFLKLKGQAAKAPALLAGLLPLLFLVILLAQAGPELFGDMAKGFWWALASGILLLLVTSPVPVLGAGLGIVIASVLAVAYGKFKGMPAMDFQPVLLVAVAVGAVIGLIMGLRRISRQSQARA